MEKIFDLRFLVPPTLFIGVFIFFCEHCVNRFVKCLHLPDGTLVAFLAGFVLAMGFIISSSTHLVVIEFLRWIKRREKKTNNKIIDDVCDIYGIEEEVKIWHGLGDNNKFFSDRFTRRWEMAFANFNCCAAILLACLFSVFINGIILNYWVRVIIVMVMLIIFFRNGWRAISDYEYVFKCVKKNFPLQKEQTNTCNCRYRGC